MQYFCPTISLLTKLRLGSFLRMLFWEMQFFCWPSFFLYRDVRKPCSVARDSTLTSSDRSGEACPREPKTFTGSLNDLKEWTFVVELGLQANRIVKKDHQLQVDYATSYLGGNAILWFLFEVGKKVR